MILGGNYLVESSSDIARKLKMSTLVIGMTIVAFGTSLPELLVSIRAALSGHSDMALGNVLGSNIVNIGFIGGMTALLVPFFVSVKSIKVDSLIMLVFSVFLFAACMDNLISRMEGIVVFILLLAYIIGSLVDSKRKGVKEIYEEPNRSLVINILILVFSFISLFYGSDMLVNGASEIALHWGIEERVISLIVVAIGTSLPELAASIASVVKKEIGITIGNILGSNIFNVGAVIGLSSAISPISVSFESFKVDLIWFVSFAVLLIIGMINLKRNIVNVGETGHLSELWSCEYGVVGRIWGALTVIVYFIYVCLLF